jgi:hypothetical protein
MCACIYVFMYGCIMYVMSVCVLSCMHLCVNVYLYVCVMYVPLYACMYIPVHFMYFIPTWRKEDEDDYKTKHTWHHTNFFQLLNIVKISKESFHQLTVLKQLWVSFSDPKKLLICEHDIVMLNEIGRILWLSQGYSLFVDRRPTSCNCCMKIRKANKNILS